MVAGLRREREDWAPKREELLHERALGDQRLRRELAHRNKELQRVEEKLQRTEADRKRVDRQLTFVLSNTERKMVKLSATASSEVFAARLGRRSMAHKLNVRLAQRLEETRRAAEAHARLQAEKAVEVTRSEAADFRAKAEDVVEMTGSMMYALQMQVKGYVQEMESLRDENDRLRDENRELQRLRARGKVTDLSDPSSSSEGLADLVQALARQYMDLESPMGMEQIEAAIKREFGIDFGGQLADLQEPITESVAIYARAREEIQRSPGYERLKELPHMVDPTLAQEDDDFETVYALAKAAQARLMDKAAAKWESYVPEKPNVQRPVPGMAVEWVDDAISPGVKGRERALEKLKNDYDGHACRLKDLARITLTYTDCSRMADVIQSEMDANGLRIVAQKNKFAFPTTLGYSDINITCELHLDDEKRRRLAAVLAIQRFLRMKRVDRRVDQSMEMLSSVSPVTALRNLHRASSHGSHAAERAGGESSFKAKRARAKKFLVEVQFNHPEMLNAKRAAHVHYQRVRSILPTLCESAACKVDLESLERFCVDHVVSNADASMTTDQAKAALPEALQSSIIDKLHASSLDLATDELMSKCASLTDTLELGGRLALLVEQNGGRKLSIEDVAKLPHMSELSSSAQARAPYSEPDGTTQDVGRRSTPSVGSSSSTPPGRVTRTASSKKHLVANPPSVESLIEKLEHGDAKVREQVTKELKHASPAALQMHVESFARKLETSSNAATLLPSLDALDKLARASPEALKEHAETVCLLLDHADAKVCESVMRVLKRLDPEMLATLVAEPSHRGAILDSLNHEDAQRSKAARGVLAKLPPDALENYYLDAMFDQLRDEGASDEARIAVAKLLQRSSPQALGVRKAALGILVRSSVSTGLRREILLTMSRLTPEDLESLATNIVNKLAGGGGEQSILDSNNAGVREAAVKALGVLEPEALRHYEGELVRMSKDNEMRVRMAANAALSKLS